MIAATLLTTLAVPAFYVLIQGLAERFGGGPPAARTSAPVGPAVATGTSA
jgi:hypothetical protein